MHLCTEWLWKIQVTSFSWKVIAAFTFLKTEANLPELIGVKLVMAKFKMEKKVFFCSVDREHTKCAVSEIWRKCT